MQNGATAVTRNSRRTGIPATIKGKPNADYGPTVERLAKAQGHVSIGDNQRGTRIYHFHDNPLDRMYGRLTRQARGAGAEATLRLEYLALTKYRHHWHAAGLQASIGSAELDRVFASDPTSMSGMAKTESQAHHRRQYREAVEHVGWKEHIILDNVVCAGISIEAAGYAVEEGEQRKRTAVRDGAELVLRESGRKLARLWGIS